MQSTLRVNTKHITVNVEHITGNAERITGNTQQIKGNAEYIKGNAQLNKDANSIIISTLGIATESLCRNAQHSAKPK